jgi:G:T/U-mismatch repair DNA glycosylase
MTVESHPLQPFLPPNARLLMLGSFPPPRGRWCMDFFYPNRTNQMWEIFGLVFFGDSQHFVDGKTFRKEEIIKLLEEQGIAIFDTAYRVRRLRDNASDKFLEVVEKTDIPALLEKIPLCTDIVCTGQKSAETLCEDYAIHLPRPGENVPITINTDGASPCQRQLRLWRMPSSSRAYPMKLEEKARHYQVVLKPRQI